MTAAVRQPAFSLLLLGPPVVRRIEPGGRPVELAWRLRKALQAVAYLALKPERRTDRDDLVEAIWPEASAEAIRKSFHPTLSDARRTLTGGRGRNPIVFNQGVYALDPETEWEVDVESFRRQIAAGHELRETDPAAAIAAWQAAWKLHRGPLMAGSEAPWIARRRDEARRDYLGLLKALGDLAVELERLTDALDAYRAVLLEEPYEEHLHIAVMELYARQGRRDLVRRQYVRLQDLLKELDVEPLDETQSSYHRLMR